MADERQLEDPQSADLIPNWMRIDLSAVAENFLAIKRALGQERKTIGVVKADAYGHGAGAVAPLLATLGVDFLANGSIDECGVIRRAGVSTPLILLGPMQPKTIPKIIQYRLIPSLENAISAQALAAATTDMIPVFVKVDCGFGRFGVPLGDAINFVDFLESLRRLRVEGIYTHLPFSNNEGRAWAERQMRLFDGLVRGLKECGKDIPVCQSLASPGILSGLSDAGNAMAVGHLMYGLSPLSDNSMHIVDLPLRMALQSMNATLVHVGEPPPIHEAAPYLQPLSVKRLGVASAGIHHGYRPTHDGAYVVIRGRAARVLRACLENTIVDLSNHPVAAAGDRVTLVGNEGDRPIQLADLARWQSSSPLMLLATFGRSLPKTYS
jgi:alanine racemase